MLKEYIINLMDSNQEEIGHYVEKLKKLQQEYQTGQEWIANLQKENDLEQNIFSPRIAAAGGLEKLEQAQEKQRNTEKQMEEVKKHLGDLKKKEEEYKGLLREADAQTIVSSGRETSEQENAISNDLSDGMDEKNLERKDSEVQAENISEAKSLEAKEEEKKDSEVKSLEAKEEEKDSEAKSSEEGEEHDRILEIRNLEGKEENEKNLEIENLDAENPHDKANDLGEKSSEITEKESCKEINKTEEKNRSEEIADAGIWIEEAAQNKDNADRKDDAERNKAEEQFDLENTNEKTTQMSAATEAENKEEKATATVDLAAKIKEALDRKNRLMQADQENEVLHKQIGQFHTMLANLYSQTELCMALMNADRNKCKSEMHKMKKMIKKYADMLKE